MELLLELYSEEIPARMQRSAEQGFKDILQKNLLENKIIYDAIEVHCGPRRICFYVNSLPEYVIAEAQMIKGPATSAPQRAIEGFCHSHDISVSSLETKLFKEQLVYYYNKPAENIKTAKILLDILPKIISSYSWPKSMYWSEYQISWVRPLRNILCLLEGEILPITYGHLKANDLTYGHSIRSPESFKVTDFNDYQTKLQNALVILSTKERINIIEKALIKKTSELNLFYKEDEKLLEEAAGLAEFPEVIIGSIEEKFMSLPAEIISTSMRNHQKYFSIIDDKGQLAPFFAFSSNAKANFVIKSGNEKVLRARLADALYFYQKDISVSLKSQISKLGNMIFHPKLGSVGDKVKRMKQICEHFCNNYSIVNREDLLMAATICKSDLVSEVIGEFPELQGIMGSIYAINDGYTEVTANAIKDHYKPLGPNDKLPHSSAAWLALSDKLDSLVGLMLAGERATSKGDAYALRRLTLGIIRIILSFEHAELNIKDMIEQVTQIYKLQITVDDYQKEQIIQFIEERAKFYFKDVYDLNVINAVLDLKREGSLSTTKYNLELFDNFTKSSEGQILLAFYKRIHNILIHNVTLSVEQNIDTEILSEYGKNVLSTINNFNEYLNQPEIAGELSTDFTWLLQLEKPIADLFQHSLVIDSDPKIAQNNLLLLQKVKQIMLRFAMFDRFYEHHS